MTSIYDMARAASMMTDEEFCELQALGWHPEIIDSLRKRGFRPCQPDHGVARAEGVDIKRTMGFLRQTSLPHLYITVANDPRPHVVLERIDTAIDEAASAKGHQQLAGQFMRFFEQCKNWQPAADLAALEQKTKNEAP